MKKRKRSHRRLVRNYRKHVNDIENNSDIDILPGDPIRSHERAMGLMVVLFFIFLFFDTGLLIWVYFHYVL